MMENQQDVKKVSIAEINKKRISRYFLIILTLIAAVLFGASYKSIKENYINIDSTITASKAVLDKYRKCHLETSCKPEDEQQLHKALWRMEGIYSREFFSLGKYLENEDIKKFNSFTKDTINSLVDMKKYGETISLISFSSEYIKPEETKQEIKTIYENRSSLNIVDLFGLSRILKDNGYYLESTTLSMSIPDHIAIATSRKLMDTFLLFGCRDDLLVWGSYYSKSTPKTFLRDETQYPSKQEYFKILRGVDSYTLDKINKTSSDMVLLKKYPELSQNCQVRLFSIYK